MADVELPDLPAAVALNDSDLLHVRQGLEDRKVTITTVALSLDNLFLSKVDNLASLDDAAISRTNLGVISEADGDNKYLLESNDLSDLTDAATARTNLGLGDAATLTVQTSIDDTTVGSILPVGAFGLGSDQLVTTTNLDLIDFTCFFETDGTETNRPAENGSAYGICIAHSDGGIKQTYIDATNNTEHTRNKHASLGTWSSWRVTAQDEPETVWTGNDYSVTAAEILASSGHVLGQGQYWVTREGSGDIFKVDLLGTADIHRGSVTKNSDGLIQLLGSSGSFSFIEIDAAGGSIGFQHNMTAIKYHPL